MKLSVDIDLIIGRYGGGSASEMARRLTDKGFKITKQGISRWRSAEGIPMQAWLRICKIEWRDTGRLPDLREFMRRIEE